MTAVDTLIALQEATFKGADRALRGSWSPERAMGPEELEAFLVERTFCVLATTTAKGFPQARPVAFAFFDDAFWFATVAGGRLRNIERTPWVSMVVSEGEGEAHRMIAADGPVTIIAEPPQGVFDSWQARIGSHPAWAAAWIELRPERFYSHTRA
jgi:hypothetical protein